MYPSRVPAVIGTFLARPMGCTSGAGSKCTGRTHGKKSQSAACSECRRPGRAERARGGSRSRRAECAVGIGCTVTAQERQSFGASRCELGSGREQSVDAGLEGSRGQPCCTSHAWCLKLPTAKLFAPELQREDEARVEHALRSAPGVLAVIANRDDHCVEVEFEDDEIDLDTIVRLGREAGVSLRPTA